MFHFHNIAAPFLLILIVGADTFMANRCFFANAFQSVMCDDSKLVVKYHSKNSTATEHLNGKHWRFR